MNPDAISLRLGPKTTRCYVCGPDNINGLGVPFAPDGTDGSRAVYEARDEHSGWPGLLHGGVLFSLMDEAVGWALHYQGLFGVTARVEARFRRPVAIGSSLVIRGRTIERRRRLVIARAEARCDADDGPLVAEAEATLYLIPTQETQS